MKKLMMRTRQVGNNGTQKQTGAVLETKATAAVAAKVAKEAPVVVVVVVTGCWRFIKKSGNNAMMSF